MQKTITSLQKTLFFESKAFKTPIDMYMCLKQYTEPNPQHIYHNFIGMIEEINRKSIVIETELFSEEVLDFYTKHNMALITKESSPNLYSKFYNNQRGGGQGDYSFYFQEKFKNVVDCLTKFPKSKRAVLTMPYSKKLSHDVVHCDDDEQKCLRELHFFIDGEMLHCNGFMRSQARIIFPKNIHFIGTVMLDLADILKIKADTYTHFITTLVDGRD